MQPPPTPTQDWFTHRRVLALVLIAGTVVTFFLCYLLVVPFLPSFAWALALAVMARPVHNLVVRFVKHCDLAAVTKLQGGTILNFEERVLRDFPQFTWAVEWFRENVDLRDHGQRIVQAAAGDVIWAIRGPIEASIQLMVTFFMLFFFFRDRQRVLEGVRSFLPLTAMEADVAFRRIRDTVHATIYGTVVVGLVQGILGGLAFWWLALPSPVLWGVIMALLGIIPILGAFLIWIPAAIWLAVEGDWTRALILTAWGSVVIGLIDNILYPVLVGNRLRLHTLTAFIAVIGGLAVFGLSGVILGPVIVAVGLALVDTWRLRLAEAGSVEGGLKEEELNPPVPPPTANLGAAAASDPARCDPEAPTPEPTAAAAGRRR